MDNTGDVEELRALAVGSIDKVERRLQALDSKDPISKLKAIKKLQELLKEANDDFDTYEAEVSGIANKKTIESLNQMRKKLASLKKQIDLKKVEGSDKEQLFKGIQDTRDKPTNEMDQDQIIQRAQQIQEDDLETLLRVEGDVDRANELAEQINAQLDEQIKKLDKIDADAKDTMTELNRTARYLRQFLRTIYTDKLLMCLIFLIFCAIIALIVLEATGIGLKKTTSTSTDVVVKSSTRLRRE